MYREKISPKIYLKSGESKNFGHYYVELFMTADVKSEMSKNCRRAFLENIDVLMNIVQKKMRQVNQIGCHRGSWSVIGFVD